MTGIGVVSTFMAKGCVDMDEPYCLYSIGLQQRDFVMEAIDAADLIITLGYDLVEYPPHMWNAEGTKTILHIDFLPAEVDRSYNPKIELVGDLAHALRMLNERISHDGTPQFDFDIQTDVRERMKADILMHTDDDTTGSIRPQNVLSTVRSALAPNDILLSGVGAHKMWIARYYHCQEPNTCLIPNGFLFDGHAIARRYLCISGV